MASPDGELTVAQRLGRALDRGLLPAGGPAEAAERLIERLERPARVALLGLPGAGKSSILNLLVGTVVVPETLRLPTIIVQHGDVPRMVCTLTDGTTRILHGADLAEVLPLAPALVTLELDLPALRVISLLEVSAGPMEAEQKRAATWASKRADIVIWCTTSYLPKEQAVWESLPDSVKDNSFMFLTKVDLLGSRDSAQAMHERVELRAGEEFRQILSISAKQARAAMPAGGQVNRDLFRDSGAAAVITAIKTRVQSGRRADMDTAELLLARHVEASELVAKRFAEDEPAAPQTWTPPPEPEAEVEAAPQSPEVAVPDPLPEPEPEPEANVSPPPDLAEVSDPEPEAAEEPEPAPEPRAEEPVADIVASIDPPRAEPEPEPQPEPEPPPGTRRRFADRIKRVASDGDAAAAPMVPLRTTWKSKNETEAPPPPPVEPEPPRAEATRRPRASAAAPAAEPPVLPDAPQDIADEPPVVEAPAATVEEPSVPVEEEQAPVEVVPRERPLPRERGGRAVTPRPIPEEETARSVRPQLFGNKRFSGRDTDSPLPDLSALRATPEEMEAALHEGADEALAVPEDDASDENAVVAADVAPAPEPVSEPDLDDDPEPVAPPSAPTTAERPRLFDRDVRGRVAEAARPTSVEQPAEARPRVTPLSRSSAPPRMPVTPVPAPGPTAGPDDAQFSPRAIMRREPREDAAAPPPRRERPRIAARAVPAAPAPVAVAAVSTAEMGLLDEAIDLIMSRSTELAAEVDPDAKAPVDLILDHARETGDLVQAVVSRGRSEGLRRITSDVGEVMDLIMLMQLEKGHAPADDALTLILQLKRELETLRAE